MAIYCDSISGGHVERMKLLAKITFSRVIFSSWPLPVLSHQRTGSFPMKQRLLDFGATAIDQERKTANGKNSCDQANESDIVHDSQVLDGLP